MTIGAWIFFVFLAIIIIALSVGLGYDYKGWGGAFCGLVVGLVISALILAGMMWYYSSTAAGARALKTQESNFNNGIERKITVYDIEGDIIQEFEGKFDVEYDDDRILFDDENGKRHIIFYSTGTVVIDEK